MASHRRKQEQQPAPDGSAAVPESTERSVNLEQMTGSDNLP
jgi:hypothetical protein